MHDVREAFHGQIFFHFHGAKFADFAEVVAAQVHEHIVFGKFLFVGQEVAFKGDILFGRTPARTRPGQRERVQDAFLKSDQGFRGRPGDFDIVA